MPRLTRVYAFDDTGELSSETLDDHGNSSREAAHKVIEDVLDWTHEEMDKEGGSSYSSAELQEHIRELEGLQSDIKQCRLTITNEFWFRSHLGFTFEAE
ncbi:hypothetical protein [Vibrio sp. Hal054]|uniref:hypothetical protein n=1 Tax=Vibrio sp. Hal054 TaxID=3035158 RepID=UPI00301DE58E